MPREWTELEKSDGIFFILASGFSLDHYPKNFLKEIFSSGVVVGVNDVALDIPCHYNVRKTFLNKEGTMPEKMPEYSFANKECMIVISEYDCGSKLRRLNTDIEGDYFYFKHNQNQSLWGIEFPDPDSDEILVSWTTTSSAIHFAAKMGARIIVLIGHDLKSGNYRGYSTERTIFVRGPSYWKFRGQAIKTQNFVNSNYDTTVVSLSPFMGIGYIDNYWPKYKDTTIKVLELIRTIPRNAVSRFFSFSWFRKRKGESK
tara:strand:+ start:105 stop:878 length:774 start_codon:yes stop_codon:yes gene_type:complete